MLFKSLYNTAITAIGLILKLVLLLFLAKNFEVEAVGLYGLISAAIAISVYIVGLDYYRFNTRHYIGSSKLKKTKLIHDQLWVHIFSYILFVGIAYVFFTYDILPEKFYVAFCFLLVAEHLSQELSRILINENKQLHANVITLVRMSGWIPIFIFCISSEYLQKNIEFLFYLWALGSILSVLLGVFFLRDKLAPPRKLKKMALRRIIIGIKIASIFYFSTLVLQFVMYADRFMISGVLGNVELGVYIFYLSLANVVQTFVLTGVIFIFYPRLISSVRRRRVGELRDVFFKMLFGALFMAIVLAGVFLAGIDYILDIVNKEEYWNAVDLYKYMLMAVIIQIVVMVLNNYLYAEHHDKTILTINVTGLVVLLCSNYLLLNEHGIIGATYSLIFTYSVQLILQVLVLAFNNKLILVHG